MERRKRSNINLMLLSFSPGVLQGVGVARGCLTSAPCGLAVHPRAFGDGECGEVLGACGVDSYGGIKVVLGGSQSHGNSVALCDLSSIGTEDM